MSGSPELREIEMTDVVEGEQGDEADDSSVGESHVTALTTKMSIDMEKDSSEDRHTSVPAYEIPEKVNSSSVQNHSAQDQHTSSVVSPETSKKHPQSESIPLTGSEQIKLDKEKHRMKEVISTVSPAAAQQVLRENWRVFLFEDYNEEHISFIVRAGLKNANSSVLRRILKDDGIFKEPFQQVASQKPAIIEQVLQHATLSQLTGHLPPSIIDKLVEERIKDAPAKDLINWLAGGDRLGFRRDDTLDESDESVIPNIPIQTQNQPPDTYQGAPDTYKRSVYKPPILPPPHSLLSAHAIPPGYIAAPSHNIPPAYHDPLLLEQEKNKAAQDTASYHAAEARKMQFNTKSGKRFGAQEDLTCNSCNILLPTLSGYNFHVSKKVCQDTKQTDGRWTCENCFSHFIGKQGLVYHNLRDVCKKNAEVVRYTTHEHEYEAAAISRSQPPAQQGPNARSAATLPPQPPLHSAPAPLHSQSHKTTTTLSATVPRPPVPSTATSSQRHSMYTPNTSKGATEYRLSPADLSAEKLASMNKELLEEDQKYLKKITDLSNNLSETERTSRLTGYKNANATRKSQIRKSYGVSLRLREKDKKLKAAADATSSSSSGRLQEFRATSLSRRILPPQTNGSGMSATDVPDNSAPGARTGSVSTLDYISQYRKAPSKSAQRAHESMSSHPETTTHARKSGTTNSGFGVLRNSNPSPMPPMSYQQVHQTNKRRRTSEGTSSPGTGHTSPYAHTPPSQSYNSGLALLHSEDAAAKYAKKAGSQKQSTPARQTNVARGDTAMTGITNTPSKKIAIVLPSLIGTGTKESAFTIVDSSDDGGDEDDPNSADILATSGAGDAVNDEDEDEDMDTPLPSIESKRVSRPSFKARRGVKH